MSMQFIKDDSKGQETRALKKRSRRSTTRWREFSSSASSWLTSTRVNDDPRATTDSKQRHTVRLPTTRVHASCPGWERDFKTFWHLCHETRRSVTAAFMSTISQCIGHRFISKPRKTRRRQLNSGIRLAASLPAKDFIKHWRCRSGPMAQIRPSQEDPFKRKETLKDQRVAQRSLLSSSPDARWALQTTRLRWSWEWHQVKRKQKQKPREE